MTKEISEATQKQISILFDRFAQNLALYAPQFGDVFLCPICLEGFHRNAIPTGQIGRAHIVPKNLGGRKYTLLCKNCNSTMGAGIEGRAHIGDSFYRPLIEGGQSKQKTRVSIQVEDKQSFGVEVLLGSEEGELGSGMTMHLDGNRMDPAIADQVKSMIIERKPFSIALSEPHDYDPIKASKVDVCVAFLAMFDLMGYEFALTQVGLGLRSLLNDPEQEASFRYVFVHGDVPTAPGKVFLVETSPRSFVVSMPSCKPLPDERWLWIPPLIGTKADGAELTDENIAASELHGLGAIDVRCESARWAYHRKLYGKQWSLKTQ